MNADFSVRYNLKRTNIIPRDLQLATNEEVRHQIDEIATFELDLEGWKDKIHAYVIPDLAYPIILGKPWMEKNDVIYHAKDQRLEIRSTGQNIRQKGWDLAEEYKAQRYARPAVASLMHAAVERARGRGDQDIRIFATSLHDINRALAPKPKLGREQIAALLPEEIRDMVKLFSDEDGTQLPPQRKDLDHAINLKTDDQGREMTAPWGPLYGMSREELLVLRKTLSQHMEKGWIRASSSSASAPVLFVRKANGDLRFCCDYRAINAMTQQDRYPLPLIKETLRDIGEAKWYTKVDIRSAFHRLRIRKGDEWKTAFRTRFGLYEWLVTPFGLAGAPASFQRFINHILRDRLGIDTTAYMDDILVYTKGSKDEHWKAVREVLARLGAEDLRLDLNKSAFAVKEISYLGFIVTAEQGVSMDPAKVSAVTQWEAPTNVRDVRAFLGFANFYRTFINSFSEKTAPLTALTKKDVPFTWGTSEQQAFESLKTAFTTAPVLAHFDPEKETVVEPDGSGWSLGSCLSQWHDGVLRPVAYLSAKLAPAEVNYDIHDKELLGIVRSLEEWRAELTGVASPFSILTDHKNLVYFMSTKKLNERQVRWAEFLSRFQFVLTHRPGRLNQRADALSRQEKDVPGNGDVRLTSRQQTLIQPSWIKMAPVSISHGPKGDVLFADKFLADLWDVGLAKDKVLQKAYEELLAGERAFSTAVSEKVSLTECTIDARATLRFRDRIWVPDWEPLKTALIQQGHGAPGLSEHPGREATREILSRQFFWPRMSAEVRIFCRNCDRCGRTKIWREAKKGLLKPLPIPNRFFSDLSIDFITDLPAERRGDNRYIMVIVDRLLKLVILEAMPTMDARACADRFIDIYWRFHGFPRSLTSDRGGNWISRFWSALCSRVGTERLLTTSHNPRSNGQVERFNQEIETILRGVISYAQTDWPHFLPGTMFAINNRQSATHGMSPFYAIHGFHPDVIETRSSDAEISTSRQAADDKADATAFVDRLAEAQEVAQAAMGWAQERMEAQANQTRRQAEQFRVGDYVWLDLRHIKSPRTSRKLSWTHAKFRVTATPFPHVVELNVPSGIHPRFHVELLRRAPANPLPSQIQDDAQPGPILEATEEEDEEWAIERIMRVEKSTWYGTTLRWALVKWTGHLEPTWEPLDEIEHSDAYGQFESDWGSLRSDEEGIGEPGSEAVGNGLKPRDRSVSAAFAKRIKRTALLEGGGIVTGHGPRVAMVGSRDSGPHLNAHNCGPRITHPTQKMSLL